MGSVDVGTGAKTVLSQIAAEELGIRFEDVSVTFGDTDVTPFDIGAHASRTTYVAGGAAKLAANDAKRQILKKAADTLEASIEDLDIKDGRIFVKGAPDKGILFSEIAQAIYYARDYVIGRGVNSPTNACPFGTQFAEVEVDIETGWVKVLRVVGAYDVGKAINPTGVEGQIQGGIQQGIGYALTEDLVIEPMTGKVVNPTFTDYKILKALDMPKIDVIIVEAAEPTGPFGAKGLGEHVMVPTAPAIANAIYDAVGVRITDLPITPDKVLKAIKKKKE